jgi:hypothetical protein
MMGEMEKDGTNNRPSRICSQALIAELLCVCDAFGQSTVLGCAGTAGVPVTSVAVYSGTRTSVVAV